MSKKSRKRRKRKSVQSHISSLTLPQQQKMMGLVRQLKASDRKARRRRRRNPDIEPRYGEAMYGGPSGKRQRLFDALKENHEFKQIDELNELQGLLESPEVQSDARLRAEIDRKIEDIRTELPATLLLTMGDENLGSRLRSLRTRESARAAQKYARRRLLSMRERYRVLLTILLASGKTPLRTGPLSFDFSAAKFISLVGGHLGISGSTENIFRELVKVIPINVGGVVGIPSGDLLDSVLLDGRIPDGMNISLRDLSYGGRIADAVLLAMDPKIVEQAITTLDELVVPNFISSMDMIQYVSTLKMAKRRLEALMGGGRIINSARHLLQRAKGRRHRRNNPDQTIETARQFAFDGGVGSVASATAGSLAGYIGTGVIKTILDVVLSGIVKDEKTRSWVTSIVSPIAMSGVALWGASAMGGQAQQLATFALAGSGARAVHDVFDVAIKPETSQKRLLRSAAGLGHFYPPFQMNMQSLQGYQNQSPVMSGYMNAVVNTHSGSVYGNPSTAGYGQAMAGYGPAFK